MENNKEPPEQAISLHQPLPQTHFNIRWPDKIKNEELWGRAKQPAIEVEINKLKWGWIGHTLRKPKNSCSRQALQWNPQGQRGRRRPRNTYRRRVTAEMERAGYRWQDLEKLAHNRMRWIILSVPMLLLGVTGLSK